MKILEHNISKCKAINEWKENHNQILNMQVIKISQSNQEAFKKNLMFSHLVRFGVYSGTENFSTFAHITSEFFNTDSYINYSLANLILCL